jgi:hypothetical protein
MNLPEYEPTDNIWQNIEAKLNQNALREALKSLPEYEPKNELWKNISSELNKTNFEYVKWVAAASFLLLIGVYFSQKNKEIKYTKQQMEPELLLSENDLSVYGYEEIKKICKEDDIVCKKPEFKALETELEELNTASTELKVAIGKYNTEPELIMQLAQIENQKSDIIRKMAAQI